MSVRLLDIPADITEHALVFSHPKDVASFAQTCRSARGLVYESGDHHLWRRLFLSHPFDDPRHAILPNGTRMNDSVDWMGELQRRVQASETIRHLDTRSPRHLGALEALISVVKGALPVVDKSSPKSENLVWLREVLDASNLFLPKSWEWTSEEQQRVSELWAYAGWRGSKRKDSARVVLARNDARGFVYDLRNYTRDNYWGPYMTDKNWTVNWVHIEMITIVINMNLRDLSLPTDTCPPRDMEALRAYSAPGLLKRDPVDWAGVEGTWRRYVCFMDYRDLFAYNYSTVNDGAYDRTFFADEDFQEATRLIEVKLRIKKVGSRPTKAWPDRPMLHFEGTSRGGSANEARVRGFVRMLPDRNIRWHFVSIYDGVEQWSSEGIQIGNVGSAAGVVGVWSGAAHGDGDPAGPFWLWKVDDAQHWHEVDVPLLN